MATIFKKSWPYYLLILIILLGAFFRLNDLASVPTGIYPDEAKNANDAIETLKTGNYKLFYPENNGREGLYIWLISLSFQLFGINIFALKLVSAIAGILTIWATYLLTKELLRFANQYTAFDNFKISGVAAEITALFSAGLIATSFWHINFSRIAFRAILVPLILSLALYFTLKAFRTKRLYLYTFSGIFWGLGFYTYIAFRLAYLVLFGFFILVFVFYIITKKRDFSIKKFFIYDKWWMVKFMGIIMIIIMLPLALYFYANPETFVARSSGISIFDTENPILEFGKSMAIHAQMLFFKGDNNWRHNFSGEAQLFWPVAVLFILGIWYSAKEIKHSFKVKNWTGITAHLTLFGALFAMMLPAALTTEGIPHALRAIGMMPFVFIYAAFGFLYFIYKIFKHNYHRQEIWPFGIGAGVIIILILASYQFTHYFVDWAQNEEVKYAFAKPYVDMGEYFNTLESSTHKYLIVNEEGAEVSFPDYLLSNENKTGTLPMPAQTILFIQQTKSTATDYSFYGSEIPIANTTYITKNQLPSFAESNSVFVPLRANEEIKNTLKLHYPLGTELEFEDFWGYV